MPVALNGWHPGERALRSKLGEGYTTGWIASGYTSIEASMPEQHRIFYTHNVPFLPLTTLDGMGRPWASLVAGPRRTETQEQEQRRKGWVRSPSESELVMEVEMWDGDPIIESLETGTETSVGEEKKRLVAGLGIEFPTRRRNKFAGWIERVEMMNRRSARLYLRVNQAIGNCPKYINVRSLDAYSDTSPEVVYRCLNMTSEERLPAELIECILRADTVFLGTSYEARESDKERYPSHVGMNARGGRPGFVRVRPSDGRTLVLPDYSGNRLMTSLGNVEATSRGAMTFLDFATGDILYLTGAARNLPGEDAQTLMPRQNLLTTLYTEAFIFVRDALPVRQRPNTDVERSPYSPPIKFLAEEKEAQSTQLLDHVSVMLTGIDILSPTLATFKFEADRPVKICPGQAAVLDFTDLLGASQYAHMAPGNETSLNDDRIRTWTVSSFSSTGEKGAEANTFSLTMREKPGGLVTGALFSLARQAAAKMPSVLEDTRRLGLRVRLVGITGSFTLPATVEGERVKMLWIAGGIGVTPFLAMLRSISTTVEAAYDIILILSTREPRVLFNLIRDALVSQDHASESKPQAKFNLALHMFTSSLSSNVELDGLDSNDRMTLIIHPGRPRFSKEESGEGTVSSIVPDVKGRLVYLCGPPLFEESAMDALSRSGVDRTDVVREGFGY